MEPTNHILFKLYLFNQFYKAQYLIFIILNAFTIKKIIQNLTICGIQNINKTLVGVILLYPVHETPHHT